MDDANISSADVPTNVLLKDPSYIQSILANSKVSFGDVNDDKSCFLQQEFFNEKSLRADNARLLQDNSRLLKKFNQMRQQLQLCRKEIRDIREEYGIVSEGTLPPIEEKKKSCTIKDLEEEMKSELLKRDQVIQAQSCQIRKLRNLLDKQKK